MKVGIVLEGGGMRGLYTSGVLDYLLDQDIMADYVIGVSAGACNGVSYVSKQRGRNFRVNTGYLNDKRYLSLNNFIKTKSLFGMDFIFNQIAHQLDLFDYDTFLASSCEFKVGVTDALTGQPVYFDKTHLNYDSTIIKASSSIPVFSPIVPYQEGEYLDGGTSDSIPVKQALKDGCDHVIVVLTRDRSFIKEQESFRFIYSRALKKYPNMIKTLDNRHLMYNETLEFIKQLEQEGKATVIAPSHPIKISRFEKDINKLKELYELGYQDAATQINKIKKLKD